MPAGVCARMRLLPAYCHARLCLFTASAGLQQALRLCYTKTLLTRRHAQLCDRLVVHAPVAGLFNSSLHTASRSFSCTLFMLACKACMAKCEWLTAVCADSLFKFSAMQTACALSHAGVHRAGCGCDRV